ncbi:PadR family transcriptional regulator [Nocardia sp. NPDC051052]|uniref:PadR family transcriptional regulator n=1 Tax=Nocardia sp. NPDC051052 TaxID=3364322 RepID=UPI0037A4A0B4
MAQQARQAVTPLAIAVLALLEEQPMHPYEMFQLLIARREDALVKVRPGSLYHTVARLAEQELVLAEGVDRAGNRPERTTYRITERGRTALRTRVAEILRSPSPEYPVFDIGLAEAHNLPKADVLALLGERLAQLEGQLAEVGMLIGWAAERKVPRRYVVVLPYRQAVLGAEVRWLTDFLAELAGGDLEWDEFDAVTGDRIAKDPHHHTWVSGNQLAPPSTPHLERLTRHHDSASTHASHVLPPALGTSEIGTPNP